ncbi:ABC transporter ATP-binding protein [Labrys sp. (in: a-proteobacteria)]|uniref:ABC transporter ATP-binding protein n=1 Tax=Labrys sp. (in: a-proteobacteria) TaxID=1917972 RepID=UPI0039E5C688
MTLLPRSVKIAGRSIVPTGRLPVSSKAEFAPRPESDRPAASIASRRGIHVQSLVKEYHTPIGRRRVLDGISFDVLPGEKVAVLGRNGSGKSTLVKLISGVEPMTSGDIVRNMFMSWPLAFSGGVEGLMTGIDNVRFIARLYNRPFRDVMSFVDDFAELGRQIEIPVRNYSSGMRMRLAFALTLAINFECFLIDEVLSVGDQRFHRKCHDALFHTRRDCAMILVSHDVNIIREFCDKALVLKNGRGRLFSDVEEALKIYETL